MADNTTITPGAGATIAADDIGGVLYQRVKIGVGADGAAVDVSTAAPMPIYDPDATASGTISATDAVLGTHAGAGALLSGTPTAASYVAAALLGGDSGFIMQLTGTFGGGTVWFECSANSTTGIDGQWSTLSMRVLGTTGSTVNDSATIAGLYRGNTSGMTYIRARITGATTPSVAVVLRASSGLGPVALNASLPTGSNTIGKVTPQADGVGAQTSVASTVTANTTLIAADATREGLLIYNESTAVLWVLIGAGTESTTVYSFKIQPSGYYEAPWGFAALRFSGHWTTAQGSARLTALT